MSDSFLHSLFVLAMRRACTGFAKGHLQSVSCQEVPGRDRIFPDHLDQENYGIGLMSTGTPEGGVWMTGLA